MFSKKYNQKRPLFTKPTRYTLNAKVLESKLNKIAINKLSYQ